MSGSDFRQRRSLADDSRSNAEGRDVPQFLPVNNALAEDAVATARTLDYDGVPVRVIGPEHLAALAFQAGGRSRRERAWQLVESGSVNRAKLDELLENHGIEVKNPDAD